MSVSLVVFFVFVITLFETRADQSSFTFKRLIRRSLSVFVTLRFRLPTSLALMLLSSRGCRMVVVSGV